VGPFGQRGPEKLFAIADSAEPDPISILLVEDEGLIARCKTR
jgi:hypothetical protein